MSADPIHGPNCICDEIWPPIEHLAQRVADDPGLPLLIPCEFSYVARHDEPGLPRIYEYRHNESRRFLQITKTGQVARYLPPDDEDDLNDDGHHELVPGGLPDALDRLELRTSSGTLPMDEYCDCCWRLLDRRRQACIRLANASNN
jgi:hypothetical protein